MLKMKNDNGFDAKKDPALSGGNETPMLFKEDSRRRKKRGEADLGESSAALRMNVADEINVYADANKLRHETDPRKRAIIAMVVVLVVAFFFSCTLPTNVFSVVSRSDHSMAAYINEFTTQCLAFIGFFAGGESLYSMRVWEIIAALLAGAALGVSGGVYQGALKNALAGPSTLGITSGGTLGVIIYAVTCYGGVYSGDLASYQDYLNNLPPFEYIMTMYGSFLCSLLGCVIVVATVLAIAYVAGQGKVSNASMVIAGQVFAAVIGVVLTWLRYYVEMTTGDPAVAELLTQVQNSSFNGVYSLQSVAIFAIPLLACMFIIFRLSPRLSLLAFSDDEARSMGISVNRTRIAMVALCTVLTALVISFVGPLGFVGFMVPHIARRFSGPDFKYLLPTSALLGAILIVVVHYVASMGIPGFATTNTGTFTSIVGCALFLYLIVRRKGANSAEWF